MALKSIKATDRELAEWFTKIKSGEMKLPRFQRYEAWDRKRISSLLSVAVNNLPLGITLILNVGEEIKFIDRYLETAPNTNGRVTEHLLDGQQRLTAFWRMMHNNYEWETYFVYVPEFDKVDDSLHFDEITGYCQTRWPNKDRKFPLWADKPNECFIRGLVPSNLLKPGDIQVEIDTWIDSALQSDKIDENDDGYPKILREYFAKKEILKAKIVELREIIAHYNLPFLALPEITPKETALNVFINMNTNSKPLSLYDIIVAEVEGRKGESLHDLENDLDVTHPKIKHYFDLSDLILMTSALLQDKIPNQRGMLDMNKSTMIENWDNLVYGLKEMAIFLESQGIYDKQRLPTNAVLAVIASLYTLIPDSGDKRGALELILKKYMWRAFFTERYENSTASRAFGDHKILKNIFNGSKKENGTDYKLEDVPIFSNDYKIVEKEELRVVKWPKGENVLGRAILAISNYLGAYDFADGQKVSREHLQRREYHHVFPDALLKEAEIDSFLALNCALITNTTNRTIGRKDPLTYLEERYNWTSKDVVNHRLKSHVIPIDELANGGYEALTEEEKNAKIKIDFEKFIDKRASLVHKAIIILCEGKQLELNHIY
ncbi:MAG: DUF262 domain-containing protein [Bacteroidales bacterium]|nr:DUF262 domain-containing protein [Bacteroidales bacterium]